MSKHLTDERLMDVADALALPAEREHAAACPACAARIDEARKGLALAREADMPEPSPLYWEAFRRQVGHRLGAAGRPSWWWRLGPILAAATALLVIVPALRAPEPAAKTLAPWSALPEADPGLDVLQGVAATGVELTPVRADAGLAEYLLELSEEDNRALTQALRAEIGESRS